MWIPAQTTVAPFAVARSAAGTSSPAGAKMIAASSSSGAGPAESPAHSAPSSSASDCAASSPARVNANTRRPWCRATCADDVRRGAEPVQPEPLGVAGEPQRAVADQARAEERRRLLVAVALRHRHAVALVGDGQLGVAAVEVVAREARAVAEVLAAAQAVAASPSVQPSHGMPTRSPGAKRSPPPATRPTTWWPRTSGSFGPRSFAARPGTDRSCAGGNASSPSTTWRSVRQTPHAETRTQHLSRGRLGVGQVGLAQRLAGPVEHHRSHGQR